MKKKILFLLFPLMITLGLPVFSEETLPVTTIKNDAKLAILTPSLKESQVLKIKLANKLEAYLISDPNAESSAASMTVKVGSWEDGQETPGIAHFLEHMLFLGTKKYPKESEYSRFITEHGGETNAFTANDMTCFMFSIDNDAFEEALDRFSSFFKEPSFNPSGVGTELHIIDQEYAKNLENDDIRQEQVWKELGNPNHPNSLFSMGNAATLSNVSQSTLKKWYQQNYSSNIMRLIVYSNLPLDKLTSLVVDDFQAIRNNNKQPSVPSQPITSKDLNNKIVYIQPVKEIKTLTLIWNLPAKFDSMQESRPYEVIGSVLGDEGKHSLLALLKNEKLATSIDCGHERLGPGNIALYLEIGLTKEGVSQLYKVIGRCFQCLAKLREEGIPKYVFDELKQMNTLNYQYQTKEDAFKTIMKEAQWIADEDLSTFPEKTLVIQKYDPEAIQELLDYLTPQNCFFDIMAPSEMTGVEPDRKEKWVGAKYSVQPIPEQILDIWSKAVPHPDIQLPKPNPFIPKNLSLVNANIGTKVYTGVPHPMKIANNEFADIYYAPDEYYQIPKIYYSFEVRTPRVSVHYVDTVVLADVYVKAIKESLNDISYPASRAGLDYDIERKENGIRITIEGYNEGAHLLFAEIIKRFKAPKISEQRFRIYRNTLVQEYQNFALDSPLRQANQLLESLLYRDYTTDKAKAMAIKKFSYKQFNEYAENVCNTIFIEGIMYGNISQGEASAIANLFLSIFKGSKPYLKSEQLKKEVLILPEDKEPHYVECHTKSQGNAVVLAIEDIDFSFKRRASQQIFMKAVSEPFFETLRTKQQTGYLVNSSPEELERRLFNIFAIQSNTHNPRDLLARFELFLEDFMQNLATSEVPETEYRTIQKAVLTALEEPPKNLSEMGELLVTLAFTYNGDFDWIDKRIKGVKELSFTDFLTISQEVFGRRNHRRAAILLKGKQTEENAFNYTRKPTIVELRKIGTFEKAQKEKDSRGTSAALWLTDLF